MWESIKKFFTQLSEFFSNFWQILKDLLSSLLNTVLDMLKDFWFWIFDSITDLVIEILDGIGELFSFDFNPASYINGLPPDVVNVIGVIRLGEALAIIVSAIIIKIILQLIPFTRLGS